MPNYVKNPTWADGAGGATPITAAKLNNVESGIFDAHYQAAARVYRTTSQSINDSTLTAIAFDAERFDTESNASSTIHSTVSNTERLTAQTAGKYQISASIIWASNATGKRELYIRLNGATSLAVVTQPAISGQAIAQTISTLYNLDVSDYVEACGFQTSGGALNVSNVGNSSPEFMMVRVA